jgi:hypothetical protein
MRFLPLFEAKMFHQFDHRWATFAGVDGVDVSVEEEEELFDDEDGEEDTKDDKAKTRDVVLAEKQDPSYLPTPRYWVSEADVLLRSVPLERKERKELELMDPEDVVAILRPRAPKWLVALRDITNTTNERTSIFTALPLVGAGNNSPVLDLGIPADIAAFMPSLMSSLVTDYMVRCKLGGTHLNAFYLYQCACLAPDQLPEGPTRDRLERVQLELVYTSEHLRPFAEACGYDGPPFPYDEDRRALLRGELDAIIARLYGLSRKQLRYILCPQGLSWAELENINDGLEDPTCSGPHALPAEPALDFPGETFRVLKDKDEKKHGDYRTRRLVLEAWARLWQELGPVEPLPIRFGPNAPQTEEASRNNGPSGYGPIESAPDRLFDVPVASGLFAPEPSDHSIPTTPVPQKPAPSPVPVSKPTHLEDEEEEEPFDLVPPEPKLPIPLKDKDGQIIRVRVLGASGQEIVPAGTVVGQKKHGDAVEWRVLPDGSDTARKFLSPPATVKRIPNSEP